MKKILLLGAVFFTIQKSDAQPPRPGQMIDNGIDLVLQNGELVDGLINDLTDAVPGGLGDDLRSAAGDMGGAAGTAANDLQNVQDRSQDAANLYNSMQVLDQNECTPDFEQSPESMMPSACIGNQECTDCYAEAVEKLDGNRRSLARMLCIYANTKRFKDLAITFGNNVSSIGGGVGFGWQKAKREIEQSYSTFVVTYDRKYKDFMEALHNSLLTIDRCEKAYGLRDWYQKFGFMYFEFMQQKYKRTD